MIRKIGEQSGIRDEQEPYLKKIGATFSKGNRLSAVSRPKLNSHSCESNLKARRYTWIRPPDKRRKTPSVRIESEVSQSRNTKHLISIAVDNYGRGPKISKCSAMERHSACSCLISSPPQPLRPFSLGNSRISSTNAAAVYDRRVIRRVNFVLQLRLPLLDSNPARRLPLPAREI